MRFNSISLFFVFFFHFDFFSLCHLYLQFHISFNSQAIPDWNVFLEFFFRLHTYGGNFSANISHNCISAGDYELQMFSWCFCFGWFSICTYEEPYNFRNNKLHTRTRARIYRLFAILSANNRKMHSLIVSFFLLFLSFIMWINNFVENMTTHHNNLLHVNTIVSYRSD